MADTYTLPALTAENINAIVTAGQAGTYNITYTNLTADQIGEIGTAFETAMQKNLKPIALSGSYSDLENKPSASNLQGFHKAAFSGKASDLNNGTGNNVTFLTKTAFDASVAGKIKQSDVNSWDAKSEFSGNYEDLVNIPNILTDISNNISNIEDIALTSSSLSSHIINTSNYNNLSNFGQNSFYIINGSLILDIIHSLQSNQIVILEHENNQWIVDSYSQYNTDTFIIELRQINSNYFYLLQNLPNKEENETEEDYNHRCNTYIIDNIIMTRRYMLLIHDENDNEFYIVKAGVQN